MAAFEEMSFLPEDFSGVARLFPLPNLVLFPHVMQPLHIFEPRYRALLEDALVGDQLIAMALLKPGWEMDYDGCPPIHPYACLGRITTHYRLDDGTYNVLLLGLRRIRLIGELKKTRLYRRARVEICRDLRSLQDSVVQADLQRKLRRAFLRILPALPDAQEQLEQLLTGDISLGVLTDLIGYMLDLDLPEKQSLLAETNVNRRAEILLAHLAAAEEAAVPAGAFSFPPQFSAN
jgi:uncharacterized protein